MVIAGIVLVGAVVLVVAGYIAALVAIGKAMEGTTEPGPLPPPTGHCTGLMARWCPIHGDCACAAPGPSDDPTCPLHAPTSTHARPHCTLRVVRRT